MSWYLLGTFLRAITVRTLRKVEHKFSTPGKVAAVTAHFKANKAEATRWVGLKLIDE